MSDLDLPRPRKGRGSQRRHNESHRPPMITLEVIETLTRAVESNTEIDLGSASARAALAWLDEARKRARPGLHRVSR